MGVGVVDVGFYGQGGGGGDAGCGCYYGCFEGFGAWGERNASAIAGMDEGEIRHRRQVRVIWYGTINAGRAYSGPSAYGKHC